MKHVASHEVVHNQNVEFIGLYFDTDNTAVPEAERKLPVYDGKAYEVERIVGDKGTHGVDKQYKVQWQGDWDDTWEPEDNLNCPKLVQQYLRQRARKAPRAPRQVQDHSAAAMEEGQPWATTVTLDLSSVDPVHMTQDICRMAGITRSHVAAQFAFVPCETYSVAGYSNSTRGSFYREHSHPDKPPRQDPCPKRDKAVLHDRLVDNVLSAWLVDREQGYNYRMFMENPRGMLQYRPFVVAKAAALGLYKRLICYCAFGHPFMKPTNVWTSSSWKPTGNTGTC